MKSPEIELMEHIVDSMDEVDESAVEYIINFYKETRKKKSKFPAIRACREHIRNLEEEYDRHTSEWDLVPNKFGDWLERRDEKR